MAETVILEEKSLAFVDAGMGGLFLWQEMPSTITLTEGETYRVVWNGTEHTCVAAGANFNSIDGIGIGNFALAGLGENNDMPFLFGAAVNGAFAACYTNQPGDAHTVAIYQGTAEDKVYSVRSSTLKGIANAIRAKNGTSGEIAVSDMAAKISEITGGGGSSDVEVVYVTFMSHDGTTELHKRAVVRGNDCMCPVAGGLIDDPTRESTASQDFTFSGSWATTLNGGADANALKNVTEDRTVYANYIVGVRHYTASFYDGDTWLASQQVPYGGIPTEYTPEKEGYKFDGWTPAFSAVKSDVSYYAKWIDMNSYLGYGECGDNATWTLTPEGVLTISGTGALKDFAMNDRTNWYPKRDYITSIIIEDGITHLGAWCFSNCAKVQSVTIPDSVISMSDCVFNGCTGLTAVNIPDGVPRIGMQAFCNTAIVEVVIPSSVTEIGNGAFAGCSKLTSATFKTTSGWTAGDTALTASNLKNKSTAATYLNSTYPYKKWTRS